MNKQERFQMLLKKESAAKNTGFSRIAGVDEAGRGPLAGPVVAAACVCNIFPDSEKFPWFLNIYDSKKVSEKIREELFEVITATDSPFHFGISIIDHEEIDRTNILKATHKAMLTAVENLVFLPDFVFVDGTEIPNLNISQEKVIKGDQKCFSVAAGSILAKVTRDRIMRVYAKEFPQYEFEKHKGYGTAKHLDAIRKHGRCEIHRKTFKVTGIDR
jgi:ribonuclease HII